MWWLITPWIRGVKVMLSASNEQWEAARVPVVKDEREVLQEEAKKVSGIFSTILDRALQASDLAKRVEELEEQVRTLQNDLAFTRTQAEDERVQHRRTESELEGLRQQLEHEQRAVHDLVMERDIVVQERNDAQGQRDSARRDCEHWERQHREVSTLLDQERATTTELRAKMEDLTKRVDVFRQAFHGLAA